MTHSSCNISVNDQGRELIQHGTADFPIACYQIQDLSTDEVTWHWHQELEAAVITDGTALVTAGDKKQVLGPGAGFFINAGILHGIWDVDHSKCQLRSLVFHPRLVGGSLDSVFYQKYVLPLCQHRGLSGIFLLPDVSWQKDCLNSIDAAWQSFAQQSPGFEFAVRGALSQLLFQAYHHLPEPPRQAGSKALLNAQRIKVMLQYIHDHASEELNVARIAQSACVSESECLRCFHTTIGTTPIQYVKQYRIQRAAQLLTSTSDRIADIAAQCGFQDISYFTKSFRELKHCVPSEYRKHAHP